MGVHGYVDETNLLDDGLVDVILDSAAGCVNVVEREGVSILHPAKFIMIGSGNPEEGAMRPQMLDRFGLSETVSTLHDVDQRTQLVLERMNYEADPEAYVAKTREETVAMRQQLVDAAELVPNVKIPRKVQIKISDLCARLGVDGLRGDLVTNRAAKALTALEGQKEVTINALERVMGLSLGHRLRKCPLDTMAEGNKVSAVWERIKATGTPEEIE